MVDETNDDNFPPDDQSEGKGSGSKGKGSGGGGSGAAGVSTTDAIRFSVDPSRLKQIWAEWKQLDMSQAIAAVADFFSEVPARASANLQVRWDSLNKGGYAVVNRVITFGQDMAYAMRTRTRESAVQIRRRYGINIRIKKGGTTVTVPNPQAG